MKNGYCTVIGGVNIDIGGKPNDILIPRDSNPGTIFTSIGGVGRNIAKNMSLMGVKTRLIAPIGKDDNRAKIERDCAESGIDISDCLYSNKNSCSTYLFITDASGDMHVAVSDMNICDEITPEFIAEKMDVIADSDLVVIDTNIPAETIKYIVENCPVPVVADPVSVTKAEKLIPVLDKLYAVAPNALEASVLAGVIDKDVDRLGKILIDKGVQRVFITCGADGVYIADKNTAKKYPILKSNVVNTTGAGDSMLAGFVYAYMHECDMDTTAGFGLAAAAITVESKDTIDKNMSEERLRVRAGMK